MTSVPQSFREVVESRRSIRKFQPEPIPAEDLREMLRLASLAPTSNNAQPARFAVVQNAELQAKLREVSFDQEQVTSAPAVIFVYSDMEDTLNTIEETIHPRMGADAVPARAANFRKRFEPQEVAQRGQWGLAQANIVFGYLTLAARSLGYDSVPMLGFQPERVRELLNLPAHVQFAGMLPVGKRAEDGHPHHRHSIQRITKFY